MNPVDRYVAEIRSQLWSDPALARRAAEDVADHLADAIAEECAQGVDRKDAELIALARLGPSSLIVQCLPKLQGVLRFGTLGAAAASLSFGLVVLALAAFSDFGTVPGRASYWVTICCGVIAFSVLTFWYVVHPERWELRPILIGGCYASVALSLVVLSWGILQGWDSGRWPVWFMVGGALQLTHGIAALKWISLVRKDWLLLLRLTANNAGRQVADQILRVELRGALTAILLVAFGLPLLHRGFSFHESADISDRPEYSFESGRYRAELPFDLIKGVLFFELRINGVQELLSFSLDTGAGTSYLDARRAALANLRPAGKATVAGVGRANIPVQHLGGVSLQLGELTSFGHTLNVTDLSGLSEQYGRRLDGFLGYDFISRFVVTIDYARRRLTISDREHVGDLRGEAIPIHFRGKWPFVDGVIRVAGTDAERSEFLIATGSGDAIDHPAILKSQDSLQRIQTGVGMGAGQGHGVVGAAAFLELGHYRLNRPLTACCGPNAKTNRLLGGEILRRFTVTLDYSRQRIIFEPNIDFHAPFPETTAHGAAAG